MVEFTVIEPGELSFEPDEKILSAEDLVTLSNARQLLENAKLQRENILSDAKIESDKQKRAAFEQGVNEAKQQAAQINVEAVLAAQRYYKDLEGNIHSLLMSAIKRIIGTYPTHETTLNIANQLLESIKVKNQIVIKVDPKDKASVTTKMAELLKDYPAVTDYSIEGEAGLSGTPGCILETEAGVIDATLSSQLTAIENSLKNHLNIEYPRSSE